MNSSTPPTKNPFQDYLNGNLSESDKAAFERRMAQNPELNHQVNKARYQQTTLKKEKRANDNSKLKRNLLFLALIGCVLIYLSNYTSREENPTSLSTTTTLDNGSDDLTTKTSPHNSKSGESRSTSQKVPNLNVDDGQGRNAEVNPATVKATSITLNEYSLLAKNLYSASDYPTGHSTSERTKRFSEDINFAKGLTHYKDGQQMEQAILAFQKISKTKNLELYNEAQSYLGHAYFRAGKFEEASHVFKGISKNGSQPQKEQIEWFYLLSMLPNYASQQKQIDGLLEKMIQPDRSHSQQRMALYLKEDLQKLENYMKE